MGREIQAIKFSGEDRRLYREKVRRSLDALGRMLRQLGFEVVDAGNGREGLDRLKAMERPDVALVDWNMPEMCGLDFVRATTAENIFYQNDTEGGMSGSPVFQSRGAGSSYCPLSYLPYRVIASPALLRYPHVGKLQRVW